MSTGKEMRIEFGKVVYDICALAVCLVFLIPVLWAFFSAFQPPSRLFTFPPNFDPRGFSLVNFQAVFRTGDVPRYAVNSLIVATTSSLITVIASSMPGLLWQNIVFWGGSSSF